MKRIVFAVVLAILVLSVMSFAQTSTTGNWRVGVGLETALPTGDFNNVSSFGIGGRVGVGYVIDPDAILTLKVGYLHFSGKDITVPISLTESVTSSISWSVIPILVGGKYYFTPGDMRWYGAADIGLYSLSASEGGGSSSKFGIAPGVGAQFKAGDNMWVDAHLNYTDVFTDNTSTSWIGIGVGLVFDLKQ